MKKYFLFDNEPITGWNYLVRILVSSLLLFFLVGFWIASATAYKRAGAIGWKKDFRVISSVLIPIHIFLNILPDEIYEVSDSGTFFMVVILLTILHFILMFKNGNKKNTSPTDIV